MIRQLAHLLSCFLLVCCLGSCSSLLTATIIEPTVANLQQQTDIELVCEGAPAYLLMIDSMLADNPEHTGLLKAAAQSYAGYMTALAECGDNPARLRTLADKAHGYGKTLVGRLLPIQPGTPQETLDHALASTSVRDVPTLFWGTLAWVSWIEQQQGSPASMAELPTVAKIMQRLLILDENYQQGFAHLFMGVYHGAKPAALGGKPQLSQIHFEKALAIGDRSFLMTQVAYAETYGRMTMDKELHDRLLDEVLAFDITRAPTQALSNQVAKRKARRLLADDYFLE